jgi:hypothetical protein
MNPFDHLLLIWVLVLLCIAPGETLRSNSAKSSICAMDSQQGYKCNSRKARPREGGDDAIVIALVRDRPLNSMRDCSSWEFSPRSNAQNNRYVFAAGLQSIVDYEATIGVADRCDQALGAQCSIFQSQRAL